jgi:predicted DNA-binding protein
MGRKKRTPIINRSFWVYAKNDEMAEKWKHSANKAGVPLSRFLGELIEQHIENGEFSTAQEKEKRFNELQMKVQQLQLENSALDKKAKMLESFAERLDEENRSLRNAPILDNNFSGVREHHEQRLIDLLKEKKVVKETELLDLMHISPKDSDSTKAIMRQLDDLQKYNLIKKSGGALRWQG